MKKHMLWVLLLAIALIAMPAVAMARNAASYQHTIDLLRSSLAAHDRAITRLENKVEEWQMVDDEGTISFVNGVWQFTAIPRILVPGYRSFDGFGDGMRVHIIGTHDSPYLYRPLGVMPNLYVGEFELL